MPPTASRTHGRYAPTRRTVLAAALLSAALMSACYWPFNLHSLAWVALVPWLLVLPRLTSHEAWTYGTLMALVFYGVNLRWLFSLHETLAAGIIIVLALWMGLAFYVIVRFMQRFSSRAMLWAVPFAFVGQEILRCEGLSRLRFVFAAFAYSQSSEQYVSQAASLGGVYLLTAMLAVVNAAVAWAVLHRTLRGCLPLACAGVCVAVASYVAQPTDDSRTPHLAAACVQSETSCLATYGELACRALDDPAHPRFVVLPEHTIWDNADSRHPLVSRLAGAAQQHAAVICVGAHIVADNGNCDYDNVAMLIGPQGNVLSTQSKLVPLPFFADGNPGRDQTVVATPLGRVGTYVCYDGLFTDHPRRCVEKGAELLLVPNMDPDRWPAQERWQHATMAPFRCIELRRCAVRANSAGISQIVDARGRIVAQRTQQEGPGIVIGKIYKADGRSPFVRGGHIWATVAGIAYLAVLLSTGLVELFARLRRGHTIEMHVPAVCAGVECVQPLASRDE